MVAQKEVFAVAASHWVGVAEEEKSSNKLVIVFLDKGYILFGFIY
jgi:hypothetical protein